MQRLKTFFGINQPGYRQRRREAVGNGVLWTLGGFLVAYVISEFMLSAIIHPWHWAVAIVVAALLYCAAFLWTLRRSYTLGIKRAPRR